MFFNLSAVNHHKLFLVGVFCIEVHREKERRTDNKQISRVALDDCVSSDWVVQEVGGGVLHGRHEEMECRQQEQRAQWLQGRDRPVYQLENRRTQVWLEPAGIREAGSEVRWMGSSSGIVSRGATG